MDWIKVGAMGVDAGLCWIGDPCYILHRTETPADLGKDWGEFCDRLGPEYPTIKVFHEGVVVSTGYGDGCYPVFVKRNKEGRIIAVKVEFSDETSINIE